MPKTSKGEWTKSMNKSKQANIKSCPKTKNVQHNSLEGAIEQSKQENIKSFPKTKCATQRFGRGHFQAPS